MVDGEQLARCSRFSSSSSSKRKDCPDSLEECRQIVLMRRMNKLDCRPSASKLKNGLTQASDQLFVCMKHLREEIVPCIDDYQRKGKVLCDLARNAEIMFTFQDASFIKKWSWEECLRSKMLVLLRIGGVGNNCVQL